MQKMANSVAVRWFERGLFAGALVLLIWSVVERMNRPDSSWGSTSSILLNVTLVCLTAMNFMRAGSTRVLMMAAAGGALVAHIIVR